MPQHERTGCVGPPDTIHDAARGPPSSAKLYFEGQVTPRSILSHHVFLPCPAPLDSHVRFAQPPPARPNAHTNTKRKRGQETFHTKHAIQALHAASQQGRILSPTGQGRGASPIRMLFADVGQITILPARNNHRPSRCTFRRNCQVSTTALKYTRGLDSTRLAMQPYDVFMLIVLIAAAAFGAWKGMAWQLASIASVLLSSIVSLRFSGMLAPSLSAEEPWNQFLAMGILFAGTSLGVWIAFRFVAKVIDRVKLKEFDRQMGALFGAAKGVLYCLILTFFAVTLSEGTRQRVLDSRSGYYAAVLVQKGTPLMPEKVRNALGKYIQKLDDGLNPDTPPMTPDSQLEDLGKEIVNTAVADTKLAFPPLGQLPAPPEQPAQPQQQAWGQVDQLGRQIESAYEQQVDQFGQKVGDAVGQQVDQFGRQIGSTLDQNYNQIRSSMDQTGEQIRSDFRRGYDAVGRRIQQAPMQPIQ